MQQPTDSNSRKGNPSELIRASTAPNLSVRNRIDQLAVDRKRLESEKAAILNRIAALQVANAAVSAVIPGNRDSIEVHKRLSVLHEAATSMPSSATLTEEEDYEEDDDEPSPPSLPSSPKLPPLLLLSDLGRQRATAEFSPEVQKLLRKPVAIGGVDEDSEASAAKAAADIALEMRRIRGEFPEQPSARHSSSSSSSSSVQSTSSKHATVVYLPKGPDLPVQMSGALRSTQSALCKYGWKCWLSNSCGGRQEEARFIHRESLLPNEETHQGQYALCCAFLRRLPRSTETCSSENFVQDLDRYATSGMSVHPSAGASLVEPDACDDRAAQFIATCSVEGNIERLRVPKGMFLLAAIYLGLVSTEALAECKGPNLPLNASLPVPARREPPLSPSASRVLHVSPSEPIPNAAADETNASPKRLQRSDSSLRLLATRIRRTVSLSRVTEETVQKKHYWTAATPKQPQGSN